MRAEVDMSNQINNSWAKPTALAMVQGALKYSILLKPESKKEIKNYCEKRAKELYNSQELIKKERLFFNRAISMTHAYLLYRIIKANASVLSQIQVCTDSIGKFLHNSLQKIISNKGERELIKSMNIKYGLEKRNSAQKYAKSVAHGQNKASYVLSAGDTQDILELIRKLVNKN